VGGEGATGRDVGCGPEIDAQLRVRVKDASVLESMPVLYTVWRAGRWNWVSMTTGASNSSATLNYKAVQGDLQNAKSIFLEKGRKMM
jgi:hypothetical protein